MILLPINYRRVPCHYLYVLDSGPYGNASKFDFIT
jgi:hypothetical protein